jgi:carbon starvation protein
MLFITVACGACSGFHSIVASGTTSKQLNRESDAIGVGYGSMLLEGFLACISLAALMVFPSGSGSPGEIYAQGITQFALQLAPVSFWETLRPFVLSFALLCFSTFVFDTLDACTRLARYILMELLNWRSRSQAFLATLLTLSLPVIAISIPPVEFEGKQVALYRVFWNIFGSSNQLLAALTLMAVTTWFARKSIPVFITAVPMVFMTTMTLASILITFPGYWSMLSSGDMVPLMKHAQMFINMLLLLLSGWLLIEAGLIARTIKRKTP